MSTETVSRKGQRGQTGKKIQNMSGHCLGLASQDQKSRDLQGWVSGCSEACEEMACCSDEDDFNRPRPAARGTEKPARGRAWGAQKPPRHRLHLGPQQVTGSWPALRCQAPSSSRNSGMDWQRWRRRAVQAHEYKGSSRGSGQETRRTRGRRDP